MKWTHDVPSEPGIYWYSWEGRPVVAVHVVRRDDGKLYDEEDHDCGDKGNSPAPLDRWEFAERRWWMRAEVPAPPTRPTDA